MCVQLKVRNAVDFQPKLISSRDVNFRDLSQSAQGAITKYHRLGGLNNRYLFLSILEAEKSKTKVPADSVLEEGPLPGLLMAPFSLDGERKPWHLFLFL